MPVIQALPAIAGTMAGRPPTVVSRTMRPSNVEPIAEAWLIPSPTASVPRACSTASRADRPVPVAERSSRPGATTTALRETFPFPWNGPASWTMLTPAMSGFSGWAHGSCSRAAARIRSPASESSRASEGSMANPSARASAIAYHMPP